MSLSFNSLDIIKAIHPSVSIFKSNTTNVILFQKTNQLIILTAPSTRESPTREGDSTPSFHPLVGIGI